MSTTTINASKQTWARSGTQSSWSAARDATSSLSHINYTTIQSSTTQAINPQLLVKYISQTEKEIFTKSRELFSFLILQQ